MSILRSSSTVTVALLASFSVATLAQAQSTGLDDMVGARAGQAEAELQRRGYVNTGGQKGDDRSYANWWNGDRRQCVTISTMNGRYDTITPTTAPDCGKSGNNDRRGAAGRDRRGNGGDQKDRYSRDARDSRHHMPVRGVNDATELQAICRAEASGRYYLRPSELTVNLPIKQRGGAIVQGWFDVGKRSTFFNCRFDEDGRFIGVS
ncbi:hypothetical protein EDF58_11818 [Novosphingobium sp. PhB57]|uniref:hypothetical protein n=1 Tax=Novosphingobium sp. PhB57 TaxID=2485107 RepID=UPI0010E807C1|nr:hypothetical protein [Novosphingobium sp. PhB57]TCU51845.1 hypothetical protein EDF58_11818 [Novosphingobium sp. PhB57]